eukprot:jgi/Botrbrau1/11677/Bobra.0195s0008.1
MDVKTDDHGVRRLRSSWVVQYQDLVVKRKIGKGSGGTVYLGSLRETDVAIKEMVGSRTTETIGVADFADSSALETSALTREVDILATLRHPNIVLFMGVCLSPPCLITEYCPQGSLLDVLQRAQSQPYTAAQLSWPRRLKMALHVAKGVLQLHTNVPTILHGDLKSGNILVDANWNCKIADFDRSFMEGLPSHLCNHGATNPTWLAPEVLNGGAHTKASDVYAFSLVLWELLTWKTAWDGLHAHQILIAVMLRKERPEVPANLGALLGGTFPGMDQYLALMRECWKEDPTARPTFTDVIQTLRYLWKEKCNVSRSPSLEESGWCGEAARAQLRKDDSPWAPLLAALGKMTVNADEPCFPQRTLKRGFTLPNGSWSARAVHSAAARYRGWDRTTQDELSPTVSQRSNSDGASAPLSMGWVDLAAEASHPQTCWKERARTDPAVQQPPASHELGGCRLQWGAHQQDDLQGLTHPSRTSPQYPIDRPVYRRMSFDQPGISHGYTALGLLNDGPQVGRLEVQRSGPRNGFHAPFSVSFPADCLIPVLAHRNTGSLPPGQTTYWVGEL